MRIIIFNCIWLLNIVFVLRKRRSRLVTAISFVYACYIYFYNTGSNDYERYTWIYSGAIESEVEQGFLFLIKIGNSLGLTFQQFQGIVGSTCLLLILIAYSKFCNNYHYLFAFYFIYQYFADLNLLRNFIMRTILLLAFCFLINRRKSYFVLFTVIASLFHRTALLYLPIVFFNIKKDMSRKTLKICAACIIMLCFATFMLGNNWAWVLNIASVFLREEPQKPAYYFTTSTHFGFLIYFGLFAVNLFIIIGSKDNKRAGETYDKYLLERWTYYINLYCMISFPLIMINTNFYRIFNNIYLVNLIYYASVLERYDRAGGRYYKKFFEILFSNYLYRIPVVQAWNQKFLILK